MDFERAKWKLEIENLKKLKDQDYFRKKKTNNY